MASREVIRRFKRIEHGVSRRDAVKAVVGGGFTIGAAKAVDNVLIGYGIIAGTNLIAQTKSGTLALIAADELRVATGNQFMIDGYTVETSPDEVHIFEGGTLRTTVSIDETHADEARLIDDEYGLDGVIEELVTDITAIRASDLSFEF